jgi:hypothetical protein
MNLASQVAWLNKFFYDGAYNFWVLVMEVVLSHPSDTYTVETQYFLFDFRNSDCCELQ